MSWPPFATGVGKSGKRRQSLRDRSSAIDLHETEIAGDEALAEFKSKPTEVMSSLVPVLFELFRRKVLEGLDRARTFTHESPSGSTVIFQDLPSHLGPQSKSLGMPRTLSRRMEMVEYQVAICVRPQEEHPYTDMSLQGFLILIHYRRFPDNSEYVTSEESQQQFMAGLLRIVMSLEKTCNR